MLTNTAIGIKDKCGDSQIRMTVEEAVTILEELRQAEAAEEASTRPRAAESGSIGTGIRRRHSMELQLSDQRGLSGIWHESVNLKEGKSR